MTYHIAQINIAKIKAELHDPVMQGFVDNIESINRLAESSPGYVWRLQQEDENELYSQLLDENLMIFTMSVWESIEDLRNFVYKSIHVDFLKSRHLWFDKIEQSNLVLWWVKKGYLPTIEDAVAKLHLLETRGPTPDAFTFAHTFTLPALV